MLNKKEINKAKKHYESVEIPEELSEIVEQTINSMEDRKGCVKMKSNLKTLKYSFVSAAACMLVLVTALNSNEAFAKNTFEIPVLGQIAKVLTIRSYEESDTDKSVTVKVPAIESNQEITDRINQVINDTVDNYIKEAEERVEEYKKAFIATGGKEEEFESHNIEINVDYEVKYQDDNMVSFVLTGTESWVNAYNLTEYYNISLKDNKELTLRDVLGDDYVILANESIRKEMSLRMEENKDNMYFEESQGGFTTVNDETKFYLNKDGNVVVVFDKYEVAPGFMGSQEFVITP